MRWRKAKKILRKKPYLLDPVRVRGMEAAKEALYEEGLPSAQELVYAACRKAGIAEEDYESFLGMTKSKFERRCRRYEPVRLGKLFRVTKKAIVIAALVVLLCLFMAATPTGRAIAISIYDAVSEMVGDILHIRPIDAQEGALETMAVTRDDEVIEFDTIEEAEAFLGYHVYGLADNQLQLKQVVLTFDTPAGDIIECFYTNNKSLNICLHQEHRYSEEHIEKRYLLDSGERYSYSNNNGITFEGCYTENDASFVGACILSHDIIEISIFGLSSVDEIKSLLCYFA